VSEKFFESIDYIKFITLFKSGDYANRQSTKSRQNSSHREIWLCVWATSLSVRRETLLATQWSPQTRTRNETEREAGHTVGRHNKSLTCWPTSRWHGRWHGPHDVHSVKTHSPGHGVLHSSVSCPRIHSTVNLQHLKLYSALNEWSLGIFQLTPRYLCDYCSPVSDIASRRHTFRQSSSPTRSPIRTPWTVASCGQFQTVT